MSLFCLLRTIITITKKWLVDLTLCIFIVLFWLHCKQFKFWVEKQVFIWQVFLCFYTNKIEKELKYAIVILEESRINLIYCFQINRWENLYTLSNRYYLINKSKPFKSISYMAEDIKFVEVVFDAVTLFINQLNTINRYKILWDQIL